MEPARVTLQIIFLATFLLFTGRGASVHGPWLVSCLLQLQCVHLSCVCVASTPADVAVEAQDRTGMTGGRTLMRGLIAHGTYVPHSCR